VVAPHEGVRVVQYLPQSLVLPVVDAVVGHGGAGTTVGALLSGLPHFVVPGRHRASRPVPPAWWPPGSTCDGTGPT
jgi:hypothetical protein